MHKLVDQSIRVDQIDLNVWLGEGGHRCIYNLVRWAVPPSAGINLAALCPGLQGCTHPGPGPAGAEGGCWCHALTALTAFPTDKGAQQPLSCIACSPRGAVPRALGRRNRSSCFASGFPVMAPSPSSPQQQKSRASPPPTSAHVRGVHEQAGPCHLQAFPPAADPGTIPVSTVGFPRGDRKSSGPVIFLPRS